MENSPLPVVVSDAGPLIHLSQISKLHLLQRLFGCVLVTANVKVEVFDEGIRMGCADAEIVGRALQDGWLKVERVPENVSKSAVRLSKGENISHADGETLLLAREKKAELLVDEKLLSDLAKMCGLNVWSTWTLLLESLRRNLVKEADIERAVDELGKKRFKLSEKQAIEILNAAKFISRKQA